MGTSHSVVASTLKAAARNSSALALQKRRQCHGGIKGEVSETRLEDTRQCLAGEDAPAPRKPWR